MNHLAFLTRLPPRLTAWLEKRLTALPAVRQKIQAELDSLLPELESAVRAPRRGFPAFARLPEAGLAGGTPLPSSARPPPSPTALWTPSRRCRNCRCGEWWGNC
ncbi:MAG: hypothetical protein HY784_09265 [Chloroflexi bacterium]|nr:hypothetical protein [Chloroflexota bacterium]